MIFKHIILGLFLSCAPGLVFSEMKVLEESDLEQVTGQGGVYLTGEFSVNKEPGPLWQSTSDRNCGTVADPKVCGLRLAISVDGGGSEWYVLDNVSGGMSFEGLTLRTEYIALDEEGHAFGKEVLKIGLPGKVRMNDYQYTFAFSNQGGWSDDPGFRQTNIYGIHQNGEVTLKGNLIMFPMD
ncbi:DUF6160 family protein [Thalassolituus sp. C2-1]|uniref:DUF6160 family protein n=1 Tax=Venatorbacter sp. C2-1 TaxID=2597518 RepID=UPI001191769E|nr:DUF6160 family protein [Thalassolituus sp. C2-1]TVV39456.1 hypothetical protein FOT50_19205 [Thalassolituus sp. C2-1]TVV39568.1 hypothetical protein FOT50_19180 [Thalassolituus sp. C2-1]